MNRYRLILFTLLTLSACALAFGQKPTVVSDSVFINFRQSKIYLDTAYMDNRASLDDIARRIATYSHPDSARFELKEVRVTGGASPEGSVKFNEWLSHRRAERIFSHLSSLIEFPDSVTAFTFLGRDWKGLRTMVEADPDVPQRAEVLALLDEIIASISPAGEDEAAGNLQRLKRLGGGKPYLYMYRKLFPSLRASRLSFRFEIPWWRLPIQSPVADFAVPVPAPAAFAGAPAPLWFEPCHCKPFYMDIRTNMLYDLLAIPNIGIEFYLGKNFSILGNWMYGWWKTDRHHRYWRAYGGEMAVRWWFGSAALEKPLTGHHLGVYGGALTYDFEWGGRGYMGGIPGGSLWDKCNYVGGLEYGYSLPVGRRLNIDFTLGVGYMGGEYREYIPMDNCYVWQATKKRNWFGPTKAEVSLVWLIGCDNFNLFTRKGGRK